MAVHTRIEINNLILNSGLFEVEIKNGVQIPRGIYRLRGKKLSSKLIERKNVRHFFYGLGHILLSYFNTTENDSKAIIEESVNDILKDIIQYIQSRSGLSELEVKKYFPKIDSSRFKTMMRKKVAETGAFKDKKASKRYYRLYNPLFKAFKQYLYPDKKTKDCIYHHIAHFLVGCKIEKPDSIKAYKRIEKAMDRFIKKNSPQMLRSWRLM